MRFLRQCSEERGSYTVIAGMSFILFLALSSLAIDFGRVYHERQKLYNAYDAAALAGAQELIDRNNVGNSIALSTAAKTMAESYLHDAYDVDYDPIELSASASGSKIIYNHSERSVTISGSKEVPLYLGSLVGFDSVEVHAKAKAQVGTIEPGIGVAPIGVERPVEGFIYNQEMKLTLDHSANGNFGFLDLWTAEETAEGHGGGTHEVAEFLFGSKQAFLNSSQRPHTKTGNIDSSSLVQSAIQANIDQERILYLPVLPPGEYSRVHGSGQVDIEGFAAFRITRMACDETGKSVDKCPNGKLYIKGIFLRMAAPGEFNPEIPDNGLLGIKLVE